MRNPLNRRSLLIGAGLGAAMLLAGCATTTTGGVTTVTLNVAKITAYAQAGLNAASTVTDALALFPGLSTYAAPLQSVETTLKAALASFVAAAGPSVTVVYDGTSIKAAVDSILSAIRSIASQIAAIVVAMAKQAALGISDATVSKVQLSHDALETIISVFQALLITPVATGAIAGPQLAMSEGRALQVLQG